MLLHGVNLERVPEYAATTTAVYAHELGLCARSLPQVHYAVRGAQRSSGNFIDGHEPGPSWRGW